MSWVSGRMQQLQRESRKRRISAWPAPSDGSGGQILLRSQAFSLLLDPRRGGRLLELSDRQSARNLLESGWIDHLFPAGTGVEEFARGRARELSNLFSSAYEAQVEESESSTQAVLSRAAELGKGKTAQALLVRKTVALPAGGRRVMFSHSFTNVSARSMEFLFASEMTLRLKDAHVNRIGEAPGVKRFAVLDPAARLEAGLSFSRPARLWHFPVETGSGLQRVYHGVKLAGVWPVRLAPKKSWQLKWEFTVEEPRGWRR